MPPAGVATPPSQGPAALRDRLTWRRLGVAWASLAVLSAGTAGVLQWLGPPQGRAGETPPATAPQPGAPQPGAESAPSRGDAGPGAPQAGISPDGTPLAGTPQPAVPHDLAGAGAPAVAIPHDLVGTAAPPLAVPHDLAGAVAPPLAIPPDLAGTVAPSLAGPTPLRPSGAPDRREAPPPPAGTGAAAAVATARTGDVTSGPHPAGLPAPAQDGPVVVAGPLAALLEPGPDGLSLPRVGADGLAPMQAYARPFTAPAGARLVAIVLDGIGLSEADSLAAINALPGAVDLAVSPYAAHPDALLRQARLKGHELLASIPMEPAGSPLNDEGGRALTADATPEANEAGLARVLGRIQGYAGATGGSDGQRGEHFALSGRPFAEVARELAARGLLYVDPAGARLPPELASRGVDLVVDEPAGAASLDARLARLEAMAQENGTALGLAGPPRPVTVERIAAWAKGLAARGFVLAPASALARTGLAGPSAAAERASATAAAAILPPGPPSGRAAGPGDPFSRRAP